MDAYLGEIRQIGFTFAPRGWAMCDGQIMPIRQNEALFSLLGVAYGGDGRVTFGLPDLRGRFALAAGHGQGLTEYPPGDSGGQANVTLQSAQMPAHTHVPQGSATPGNSASPSDAGWAQPRYGRATERAYGQPSTTMSAIALSPEGGNRPHNNMPPYVVVNFIIALTGNFPPRQ